MLSRVHPRKKWISPPRPKLINTLAGACSNKLRSSVMIELIDRSTALTNSNIKVAQYMLNPDLALRLNA
jgi:hypothetical protein